MKKLILMMSMITLISSCDGSPEPDVEYSYFTYVGPVLFECKGGNRFYLRNCISILGDKVDVIYNATYFRKER